MSTHRTPVLPTQDTSSASEALFSEDSHVLPDAISIQKKFFTVSMGPGSVIWKRGRERRC